MKRILFISLLVLSTNSMSSFNDEIMQPHLGPYKIKVDHSKNCPKKFTLIAMCSLSELSLKHNDELDFDFAKFSGINEGELVTTNKGKIVQKSITSFKNKRLTSNESSYMKRFDTWQTFELELTLKDRALQFKKSIIIENKKRELYNCEYDFDEATNRRNMSLFKGAEK